MSRGHLGPQESASFCVSPGDWFSQMRRLCLSQSCTISPDTLNQGRKASWREIKIGLGSPGSRAPQQLLQLSGFPVIFFLTAQQRRLRRTYLKDYPQELSHISSQTIIVKTAIPGAPDCSLKQEFALENKMNPAPRAMPKRLSATISRISNIIWREC